MVLACLALVFFALFSSASMAETRKLKLYFLHTGERAEITYKKNGKYIKSGLNKVNKFLRDWRRNEPTKMDPKLLDLIWEVYKETGSRKYIHVVSAYRSPATNNLLRKRGRGVAKKSQHTLGKALDFFIPGVNLRKLRNVGLRKGLGGVGYYPKSGSPFVHMDTGRVRHWPRMSRKELARVFPKGKTLHVPTDGKPLARYNQAKAEYERKVKGSKIVVAKAEDIVKKPSFFAKLLGRGEDEEDSVGAASAPKAVKTTKKPVAKPKPAEQPKTDPAPTPTLAEPVTAPDLIDRQPLQATPEILLASLPADLVPVPVLAPRAAPEPDASEIQAEVDAEAELTPVIDETLKPSLNDGLQQTVDEPIQPVAIADASESLRAPRPQVDLLEQQIAETIQTAQTELTTENEPSQSIANEETTELAYAVPVPSLRPEIKTVQPDLLVAEPVTKPDAAEKPIKVAALSPAEIEDLRQEVYSILTGKDEPPNRLVTASSEPTISEPDQPLKIAAQNNENNVSNALSLVPQPNPNREVARAIDQQIAPLEAIEPNLKVTGDPAVPQTNPRAKEPEIEVATLEPIEPGVTQTGTLALPLPNPATTSLGNENAFELASESADPNIPVPQAAQRKILIAAGSDNTDETEIEEIRRLESLQSVSLDEKIVGKWALAANLSIADIAEIRPPAYARNIIREMPRTVLSRGFVQDNNSFITDRFSGSSIEFLDFTRFN